MSENQTTEHSAQPGSQTDDSGLIKYTVEYMSRVSEQTVASEDYKGEANALEEPPVMEYVEVRLTNEAIAPGSATGGAEKKKYHEHSKGHSYIRILSPAVNEALRCVVDYYPSVHLSGTNIKVLEPFEILVFYERELTEYRNRLDNGPPEEESGHCANRYASKHIGIVQDFVRKRVQIDVEAERERHSRGFATFDMLWLLYKPGSDCYYDASDIGEHEPYVVKDVKHSLVNGAANSYELTCWNIDGTSSWVGACEVSSTIQRFAGEKEIVSFCAYPCEYLRFSKDIAEGDPEKIREHFTNQGKKWYALRQKKHCYAFDGLTYTIPRRMVSIGHSFQPSRQRSDKCFPWPVHWPRHGGSHELCLVDEWRQDRRIRVI